MLFSGGGGCRNETASAAATGGGGAGTRRRGELAAPHPQAEDATCTGAGGTSRRLPMASQARAGREGWPPAYACARRRPHTRGTNEQLRKGCPRGGMRKTGRGQGRPSPARRPFGPAPPVRARAGAAATPRLRGAVFIRRPDARLGGPRSPRFPACRGPPLSSPGRHGTRSL